MIKKCLLYTSFPPKKLRFSHPAMSVLTIVTMIITMKMVMMMMKMTIIIIIIIIIIKYVNVITQNHYPQQRQIKSKILPDIFGHFNKILLSFCPSVYFVP